MKMGAKLKKNTNLEKYTCIYNKIQFYLTSAYKSYSNTTQYTKTHCISSVI